MKKEVYDKAHPLVKDKNIPLTKQVGVMHEENSTV
jgi:hypothetical protein